MGGSTSSMKGIRTFFGTWISANDDRRTVQQRDNFNENGWEHFRIVWVDSITESEFAFQYSHSHSKPIVGEIIHIQTIHGTFLQLQPDGTLCQTTSCGAWETFEYMYAAGTLYCRAHDRYLTAKPDGGFMSMPKAITSERFWLMDNPLQTVTRVVIYDTARMRKEGKKQIDPQPLWALGAGFGTFFGRYEHKLAASSWQQVFDWLLDLSRRVGAIDEVHFWGHGVPGAAFVHDDALQARDFGPGGRFEDAVARLRREHVLHRYSYVWFRTCSTFHGPVGKRFARSLANTLQCRVAGFTYNIGNMVGLVSVQSGLRVAYPNREPDWSDTEGGGWSSWNEPSTIASTTASPEQLHPRGWMYLT